MDDIYGNGAKETWRNWMLNRICERIPPEARKDAVGVYLPSQNDRERPAAIDKGFTNANLIAVDRDSNAVCAVRATGGVAMQGELLEVLRLWPHERRRLDFISADLMCDLTPDARRILFWMLAQPFAQCVCTINLMRGRDQWAGRLSKLPEARKFNSYIHSPPHIKFSRKHRGIHAAACLLTRWTMAMKRTAGDSFEKHEWYYKDRFMRHANFEIYSYRSEKGMMFDSLVFTCSGIADFIDFDSVPMPPKRPRSLREKRVGRKMAAAFAIQTMKRSGRI